MMCFIILHGRGQRGRHGMTCRCRRVILHLLCRQQNSQQNLAAIRLLAPVPRRNMEGQNSFSRQKRRCFRKMDRVWQNYVPAK